MAGNSPRVRRIFPEPNPDSFSKKVAGKLQKTAVVFAPFPIPIPMRGKTRLSVLNAYASFHKKAHEFLVKNKRALQDPEKSAELFSEKNLKKTFGDSFSAIEKITGHERQVDFADHMLRFAGGRMAVSAQRLAKLIAPEWVDPLVERTTELIVGKEYLRLSDETIAKNIFQTAKFFEKKMLQAKEYKEQARPMRDLEKHKLELMIKIADSVHKKIGRQIDWITLLNKSLSRVAKNPSLVSNEIRYLADPSKLAGIKKRLEALEADKDAKKEDDSSSIDVYFDDSKKTLETAGQRLSLRQIFQEGETNPKTILMLKNPVSPTLLERAKSRALRKPLPSKKEYLIFDPFKETKATKMLLKKLGIKDATLPKTTQQLIGLFSENGLLETLRFQKNRLAYTHPEGKWKIRLETGMIAQRGEEKASLPPIVKITSKKPREPLWAVSDKLGLSDSQIYPHPNYQMGINALNSSKVK